MAIKEKRMNTFLTDAAIYYTWDQIFYRLGIKPDESGFAVSGKRIVYCYGSPSQLKISPDQFLLNILPCTKDAFETLMTDHEQKLSWLRIEEFLPNPAFEFPTTKLPALLWGEFSSRNKFAEIKNGNQLIIHFDLIASIFFMLSRAEEYKSNISDRYGRYPFSESATSRHNFIDLPIVDLYVKVLKFWLEELAKEEIIDRRQFKICLSHDIDFTSLFHPFFKGGISIVKDVFRLDLKELKKDVNALVNSYKKDPYFLGIANLVEQSTKFGFVSTFNIMAASPSLRDAGYSLSSPIAKDMLNLITNRGHKIGLHSSFNSFDKKDRLKKEKSKLEKFTGGNIDIIRSHYLRLKTPESWEIWQAAGLKRDTSYAFAENEGFRCGTCIPYQVFDIKEDKTLDIIEEPLIVMDTTLKNYRQLTILEAKESIYTLAQICKFVGGNFTLLWHNTSFFRDWKVWGNAYPEILSSLSSLLTKD